MKKINENLSEKNITALKIRELEPGQIEEVYETYMRADFPVEELKPLRAIMDMRAKGAYDCLGLFGGDQLLAYAYMVKELKQEYVLLDYLAACAAYRDQGIGSRMLDMLREWYREKNGIFLECECLRTSADEMQMKIRRRRQDFYLRNGCVMTGVKTLVYGVEYDILYIPLKESQPEYGEQLDILYREMFSEKALKAHVRIWNRNRSLRCVYRWSLEHAQYEECCSLTEALGICPAAVPRVISLVGAGGKTTTMYQLADELAEMGKRVLVTATTHIARPVRGQVLEVDHVRQVTEAAWKTPVLTVGSPEKQGKPVRAEEPKRAAGLDTVKELAAPAALRAVEKLAMPAGMDNAGELGRLLALCDVILIEADGAACHPVKVPREGEPVILPQTELVIACAGLCGLGQVWKDGCFRFESDGAWLNRQADEAIGPEDVARILSDVRGSKKDLPQGGCKYRILLNQADDGGRMEPAAAVALALPENLQKDCVVTTYYQKNQ